MGDIAEMTIDGILDFYTGEYIGPGVGYPRTQTGPIYWGRPKKTKDSPMKGVNVYLSRKGIPYKDREPILRRYAGVINYELLANSPIRKLCREIQKDFTRFQEWIESHYVQQ